MTGGGQKLRRGWEKSKRLIGEKNESKGMKDNVKMTLIERWNDVIWRKKEEFLFHWKNIDGL